MNCWYDSRFRSLSLILAVMDGMDGKFIFTISFDTKLQFQVKKLHNM